MNLKILNIVSTIAQKARFFASFKFLAFFSVLSTFGILALIFPEIAQASGSFWGALVDGGVNVVAWIVGGIINFVIVYIEVPLLEKVLDITAGVLANTDVMSSPLITGPWQTIRDLVNIAFIGILILISLMNIIGVGADKYSIQAAMPKFIFAVIAVNFSKLFCTLILDLFNVVSASLYNFMMGGQLGKYGEKIPDYLNTFYKFNDEPTKFYYNNIDTATGTQFIGDSSAATVDISTFSVDQVIIAIVLGILIMGFMGLTFTFLVRMVWLWILTITSPVYFLGMSISIFSSLQKMWWDKFLKYALIPVKVAAILSGGLLIHNNLMKEMNNSNPASFGSIWRTFWHPEDINNVILSESSFIIGSLIVAGVCYAAFKAAHDDGMADSVNGWFKNKFPGMALGMTDKALKIGSNLSYGLSQTNIPGLKKVLNPLGRNAMKVFDAPYKLGDAFKGYTDLFSRERKERIGLGGAGLSHKFIKLTNRDGLLTKKMEGKIRAHEAENVNRVKNEIKTLAKKESLEILDLAMQQGDIVTIAGVLEKLAEGGDFFWDDTYDKDGKKTLKSIIDDHGNNHHLKDIYGENPTDYLDDKQREALHRQTSDAKKVVIPSDANERIALIRKLIEDQEYGKAVGVIGETLSVTKDPFYTTQLTMELLEMAEKNKNFASAIEKSGIGTQFEDLFHGAGKNPVLLKMLKVKLRDPAYRKKFLKAQENFQAKAKILGIEKGGKDYYKYLSFYLSGDEIVKDDKVIKADSGEELDISNDIFSYMKNEKLKKGAEVENYFSGQLMDDEYYDRDASGNWEITKHDMAADLKIRAEQLQKNLEYAQRVSDTVLEKSTLNKIEENRNKIIKSMQATAAGKGVFKTEAESLASSKIDEIMSILKTVAQTSREYDNVLASIKKYESQKLSEREEGDKELRSQYFDLIEKYGKDNP